LPLVQGDILLNQPISALAITIYNFNQPDISYVKNTGQLDVLTTEINNSITQSITQNQETFEIVRDKKMVTGYGNFVCITTLCVQLDDSFETGFVVETKNTDTVMTICDINNILVCVERDTVGEIFDGGGE